MLWLHYSRAEEDGRVADTMRDSHSRAAIYGSVLDCSLRHFGRGGPGSVSGKCARYEGSAWAENGGAGEPVVDEAAHTYGLLRNWFRPSQQIRTLRTYWRQRQDLMRSAVRHIQRMQKALTQMNIQLANVISDITGSRGRPS